MRLTAIDIGTNTILMLIADLSSDGTFSVVRDEQVIARLGKGVDAHRKITPETTERVIRFLRGFLDIAHPFHPDRIVACGTSALRDAVNGKEFVQSVRRELGLEIAIVSGDKEAELTYLGAASEFLRPDSEKPFAVIDIGGGSTELTIGNGHAVKSKTSFDLGSVRLTERTLKKSPPALDALNQAEKEIRHAISSLPKLPPGTLLTGVAGTATTLAAIDLGLRDYDPRRVSGHELTLATVDRLSNQLGSLTIAQMAEIFPQIQPGRSDIIFAGTLILKETLKYLKTDVVTVSDRGLRYGIALREFLSSTSNA